MNDTQVLDGSVFLGHIWTLDTQEGRKERVSIYLHPKQGYLVSYIPGVGEGIGSSLGVYHIEETEYIRIIISKQSRYKMVWHNISKGRFKKIVYTLAAEEL
jgi:hypothetical protein